MKKILIITLAAIVAVAGSANSQEYQKNILGVRAGMNISKINVSAAGVSISTNSMVGFNVGVSDQILLTYATPLYLETGLYFTTKGGKGTSDEATVKLPLMYLQVPVLVNYHFNIGNEFSIQPFAGAYYGLGICGKIKSGGNSENIFTDEGYKRSDIGLRFGVNFTYSKFLVGLGYDLGLNNIAKDTSDLGNAKVRNRVFSINLGYNF